MKFACLGKLEAPILDVWRQLGNNLNLSIWWLEEIDFIIVFSGIIVLLYLNALIIQFDIFVFNVKVMIFELLAQLVVSVDIITDDEAFKNVWEAHILFGFCILSHNKVILDVQ